MYRIALKMLFGDRGKYLLLVSGLTFSTLLMTQFPSVFCGLMTWTYANIMNSRSQIWVTDAKAEQSMDNKPLRDIDVYRVRSVEGVAWAAPYLQASVQVRLPNGDYKQANLVGLDAATLAGAPVELLAGSLEDLRQPDTIITDELGIQRFSKGQTDSAGQPRRVGLGDTVEINDREARIVGLARTRRSFTGGPFVFTTYDRAREYVPAQRKQLTFILAAPAAGEDTARLCQRIEAETGLKAQDEESFRWATIWWYVRNTGIPFTVGSIVIIGAIVGMVIATQTFYAFVLENLRHLAALKAMGTGNLRLATMLLLQAWTTGLIGYGIGAGLASLILRRFLAMGQPAVMVPWQLPTAVFGMIMVICTLAAILGIIRVARTEPAIVFR